MSAEVVQEMLSRYEITDRNMAIRVLREVLQELILFSLYQAKFFDSAVFYGGTALRIIHKLDRFSEDLDFSLREPVEVFPFRSFGDTVIEGLDSFGIAAFFETKERDVSPQGIARSHVRTGPIVSILSVDPSNVSTGLEEIARMFSSNQTVKIRLEVDTGPARRFSEESAFLLYPIPFPLLTMRLPSMFAGKMHALLCRSWGSRVKGRDWYDLIWFVKKRIPLEMGFLEEKLRESGHWKGAIPLTINDVRDMYLAKVEVIDVEAAKMDVEPFLRDARSTAAWSRELFASLAERIDKAP